MADPRPAPPSAEEQRARLMEYAAPEEQVAPEEEELSVADYAAPRTPLGRGGKGYASEIPFEADNEARLAWGRVRDDLITAGVDPDIASEQATRTVRPLQALGHVEDPEATREALDAYEGELTPGKMITQVTNRLIPLGPRVASTDEEWRDRAAAYSGWDPAQTYEAIDKQLSGEPMSAEDAHAAGMDKEWARKGVDLVRKVALAPGSPVASAVVAAGGVSPYVPTMDEIGNMGEEAMDVVSRYANDPDVQALTGGDKDFPVAAEFQRALGQWAVDNTPAFDALPAIVDAGVAAYDAATGDTLAEKIKAKKGKSLGEGVRDRITDMRQADAFDPAAKKYYETGDPSLLLSLSDAQIPENVPRERPSLTTIKAGVESLEGPEADALRAAIEAGRSDDILQPFADKLPLSEVRKVQPTVGPSLDDVVDAHRRRTQAKEEAGGVKGEERAMRVIGSAMLRPDVIGGEKVFVPSAAQKLMSIVNVAEPAVIEADVPVPAAWIVGKGLKALGAENLGGKLESMRFPTPAGWDSMVASGDYDELLEPLGLAGSSAQTLRDDRSNWHGRMLADLAMPEYQTLGSRKALRLQGVRPGSKADQAAGAVDFLADMFVPWEEIALGPAAKLTSSARRAWVGGKAARDLGASGSVVRRAALESALSGGDAVGALSQVLDKGFRDDLRAGRRVFSVGEAKGSMDFRFQRELEQQLRNAGINPDVAFKLANDVADANKAQRVGTVREWMKRGAPQDVALRAKPEYQALRKQYAALFAPIDVDAAMALNEQAAWQAVADGKIAKPEEWFFMQRVEKGGEVGEGAYFQKVPLTSADVLDRFRKAQFISPTQVVELLGDGRPAYLDDVAKFILEQREKVRSGKLTRRDVAKAYLMTVASQRAGEISKDLVETAMGSPVEDAFTIAGRKGKVNVRPEEAMAAWLFTPDGQRALDELDAGTFDPAHWESALRVRDTYGNNTLRNFGVFGKPGKGQVTFANLDELVDALNSAHGDLAKVDAALSRAKGISSAKTPFLGHLLGFGESPTVDAVEINGWLTGQADVGALKTKEAQLARDVKTKQSDSALLADEVARKVKSRFAALKAGGAPGAADLPDEVFGAIMHHWFWDKLKSAETTHEGMYKAMRYASERNGVRAGDIGRVPLSPEAMEGARYAEEIKRVPKGRRPPGGEIYEAGGNIRKYGEAQKAIDAFEADLSPEALSSMEERSKYDAFVKRFPDAKWEGQTPVAIVPDSVMSEWRRLHDVRDSYAPSGVLYSREGDVVKGSIQPLDQRPTIIRTSDTSPRAQRLREATEKLLGLYPDKQATPDAAWLMEHPDAFLPRQREAATAAAAELRAARLEAGIRGPDRVLIEGIDSVPPAPTVAPRAETKWFSAREGAATPPATAKPSRTFDGMAWDVVSSDGLEDGKWYLNFGFGDRQAGFRKIDDAALEAVVGRDVAEKLRAGNIHVEVPAPTNAAPVPREGSGVLAGMGEMLSDLDEAEGAFDAEYQRATQALPDDLRKMVRAKLGESLLPPRTEGVAEDIEHSRAAIEYLRTTRAGVIEKAPGWAKSQLERFYDTMEGAAKAYESSVGEIEDIVTGAPYEANAGEFFSRTGPTIRGSIEPGAPVPGDVPNPARAEWVTEGRALRDQVRAAEAAEVGAWWEKNGVPDEPTPTTFAEAQKWWNDHPGDVSTMPEPSPALLADMDRLDAMRRAAPPVTIPGLKPPEAKWLIRYFETADPHTILHENAHLIRFVLGDDWMDDLARFFDHETVDGTVRLTRDGEEQFAEALTRVLRGQLAPRGRLGVYLGELRDTLSDLWRQLRNKPVELPPGFREWWDAKLDPAKPLRTLIDVVDERIPRELGGVGVTVDPETRKPLDVGAYLEKEPVKRAGQVRGYMSMDLTPGQTQHMFGLGRAQTEADAIDVLAKGIAALGVSQAQRKWGFTGDLARVTARSAVPVARKASVLEHARGTLERAMGGIPADLSKLTEKQARGLADHVAHLADAGWAEELPRSVLSPSRDFRTITEEEYRAIVDATVDDVAGPGAARDRRTEKMAGNLAVSLIGAVSSAVDSLGYVKGMKKSLLDMFDSSFRISENLNPAAAEVVERARRKFGQIPADVVRLRAEFKAKNPSANAEEIIRAIADGIPRLGAAPENVDELMWLDKALGRETTMDRVVAGIDAVARQFSADPARSQFQRTSEREAIRVLRDLKRGETVDPVAAQNAVAVIQSGLHRRSEAVKGTGLKILQGFMGKPELKHATEDPIIAPAIYKAWYQGDWQEASRLVGTRGGATDPLSNYDPLAAALSVTTQLLGDGAMAKFGNELIDLGLPIHTDAVNLAGRDFARWIPLGDARHTGEEYRALVHQYMNAILTFGAHEQVDFTKEGVYLGRQKLPAQLGPDGTVNLSAWQDAHRILNAWGVKDGTSQMERLLLPTGEEMWVPDVVKGELSGLFERTAKAGLAWTQSAEGVPEEMLGRFGALDKATGRVTPNPNRKIRNGWLPQSINQAVGVLQNGWNTTWGLQRVGVTTGIGLPNMAFYTGNVFGGLLQLYQRKGAVETLRALGRYLSPSEDGTVLRSVYTRMWGDGKGYFKAPSSSLVDKAGRVMSDRWIAQEAVAAGFHSSQPKAESAIRLIEDIRNNEGKFWGRVKRDGVWGGTKESFRYWQGLLTEASSAVDDLFRVAAFVDELKGGATSAEAASVARAAAFDYNDLTDFEKKVLRRTIMFYTYQRRNTDLFWWTMLHHPSRVMGQYRAIRDLQRIAFGDDETAEMVMSDHLDGRMVVAVNQAVGDEEAVKGTMGIALLLPQVPAADHLGLWTDLFRALDEDSDGRRELLARTTPEVQFLITMATDMDIFSGRDLAAYSTVPAWMVEMDRQLNGGVVVDDLFRVRKTQNRDPATDESPGNDRWEPTGAGSKWWWVWRSMMPFGRSTDTITQLARADWLVNGAVDDARWFRNAQGITGVVRDEVTDPLIRNVVRPALDVLPGVDTSDEPFYEPATVGRAEEVRTGFTPGAEKLQAIGLKSVAIPTPELALDKAEMDRLRRAKETGKEEERRDPYRYGR